MGLIDRILNAIEPRAERKMPAHLGGYKLIKLGEAKIDRRQKHGVPVFYAQLIERNRYAPHWTGVRR